MGARGAQALALGLSLADWRIGGVRPAVFRRILVLGAGLLPALPAAAQEERACVLLCTPDLKIEPTVTLENLGRRARIEVDGAVERTPRETVFEVIFAVGVPTEIPRIGFTFEAIVAPSEAPRATRSRAPTRAISGGRRSATTRSRSRAS